MAIDTYCVYWIHLPSQQDMFTEGYIGITKNPLKRWRDHKSAARCVKKGTAVRTVLTGAINKYEEELLFDIIVYCTAEYACYLENALRPSLRIGWNIAIGGDKPLQNLKHTDEQRAANSRSKIGKYVGDKNPMFGKTRTAEERLKISKSHKRLEHHPARFKSGKDHPNNKGSWHTPLGVFNSLREAAEVFQCDKKTISMRCFSTTNRFKEWYFEPKEAEETQ